MNKKLLIGLGLGIASIVGLEIYSYNPCKPSQELDKAVAQEECIKELKAEVEVKGEESFRDELCQVVGKQIGCSLVKETDEAPINRYIVAKVQTCIDVKLKQQNFCIDNSKE